MRTIGIEDLRNWEPFKTLASGAFMIKICCHRELCKWHHFSSITGFPFFLVKIQQFWEFCLQQRCIILSIDLLNYVSNAFAPRTYKVRRQAMELGQVSLLNFWRLAFSIQVDGAQRIHCIVSVCCAENRIPHTERSQIGSERGIQ